MSIYAKQTDGGIVAGTAAALWPRTSIPRPDAFAASRGFSVVVGTRPYSELTQRLEPTPVYEEGGVFYNVKVAALALPEVAAKVTKWAQARMDAWAQTRGYDSIKSLRLYQGSAIPRFAVEAARGAEIQDHTWATLYALMDAVAAGTAAMPAADDLPDLLPALRWPDEDPPT